MSSRHKAKRQKVSDCTENVEIEEHVDVLVVPGPNDSGDSDCQSDSENGAHDENLSNSVFNEWDNIPKRSYQKLVESYTLKQLKLEPNHIFEWVDGEMQYDTHCKNKTFLSVSTQKQIRSVSSTELFKFFCQKI